MFQFASAAGGQLVTIRSADNDEREFFVDDGLPARTTQHEVFNSVAKPLVDKVFEGFNAMGYAALLRTHTGKTYTMVGESEQTNGIVPRVAEYLYNLIESDQTMETTVFVSFLEVYLDQVFDLLGEMGGRATAKQVFPGSRRRASDFNRDTKLEIHEDVSGLVYVRDLTMVTASSAQEMLKLMHKGMSKRATFGTNMNDRSSRSHTIFSVSLVRKSATDPDEATTSVLNLVDLAGSERLSKSGSEGLRQREAQSINRSLSALGNTVVALARGDSHIPYRDSKLTRLLQDSLGGNSYTSLIATLNPTPRHYEECLATVMFAHRCRNVKNTPTVNYLDVSAKQMEQRIKKLQEEVADLRSKLADRDRTIEMLRGKGGEYADDGIGLGGSAAAGGAFGRRTADDLKLLEVTKSNNMHLKEKLERRKGEFELIQNRLKDERRSARLDMERQKKKILDLMNESRVGKHDLVRAMNEHIRRHEDELNAVIAHNKALLEEYHRMMESIPLNLRRLWDGAAEADSNTLSEVQQIEMMCAEQIRLGQVGHATELEDTRLKYEFVLDKKQDELDKFVAEYKQFAQQQTAKFTEMAGCAVYFAKSTSQFRTLLCEVAEGKHPASDFMGRRAVRVNPDAIPAFPDKRMQDLLAQAKAVVHPVESDPRLTGRRVSSAQNALRGMQLQQRPATSYIRTRNPVDRTMSLDHLVG
ncbi:Kinesin motor domain [Carpediemonas membranifera]|uniref:Kinesin-like protein n=1 Tax=Carpediemonas membranifera TaxID=201153 RepID=A0A8J6E3G4_9EUKA|nr:Kinesin motor domain [Carpediemonas membranifera]|eukprot:KAG9395888.1 Kinesin motor domain [Carpediemonas membranifera]